MSAEINLFSVGDIVTYRSHPLLYDYSIKGDGKYVPPIMVVKEVFFERENKKTHDDISGKEIAEKIKYNCIYFDDNKSEFIEVFLYEKMLESFTLLHIGRIDDPDKLDDHHVNLIDEILSYPSLPTYEYGKIVYFKTKKLEVLKKRTSKSIVSTLSENGKIDKEEKITLQYIVNYSTPDFIIGGYKKESVVDSRRLKSTDMIKVQWFNPLKQKFSSYVLPLQCFTDIQPFDTKVPHKKSIEMEVLPPIEVIKDVQEFQKQHNSLELKPDSQS